MEVKRFEGYKSGDYDYEYGGYAFVLARPKQGWKSLNGSLSYVINDMDYVPCLVTGHILYPGSTGQHLLMIGDAYSYYLDKFDIIKDSDKGFKEMIELYSSANKYNL